MNEKHTKWMYLFILSIIWGSSFILIKKSLLGLTEKINDIQENINKIVKVKI